MSQQQQFLVRVDEHAVRKSLSKADGIPYSTAQVRQFLWEAGFQARGTWWVVCEHDLGHLDPAEVLEARPWTELRASAQQSAKSIESVVHG